MVDWQLLLLFLGLFVVNREVAATGLLADLNRMFEAAGVDLGRPGWLFSVTAVLSNIVSNVPAVMRGQTSPDLRVPELRSLAFLRHNPGSNLTDLAEYIGVSLPSMDTSLRP